MLANALIVLLVALYLFNAMQKFFRQDFTVYPRF